MINRLKNKIKFILSRGQEAKETKLDIFHYLPEKLDVLFDVGAHKGFFTKEICSKIRVKNAFLFEPIPEVFNKLITDEFFKSKYKCYNTAISSEAGEIEFNINENLQTSSLLAFDNTILSTNNINKELKKRITIQTNTLKNFMTQNHIQHIDLLKIDVQGADLEVLKGLEDNIINVKRIFIEVSFKKIYENSSTFFEIFDYLVSNGFILINLYPVYWGVNSELLQSDALFINTKTA